jgi:peptidyl-prolyl cis-trans isomerase D
MQAIRSLSIKIAAALFAILMLVFMVTAVDWSQITGGSRSSVGEINGVSVSYRNYQQMVQQALDRRQREEGRTLNQEDIEQVRNEVWDQLVQQMALNREYRRRHIGVTADEIAEGIRTTPLPDFLTAPQFQTEGRFDPAKYQAWLQSTEAATLIPALEGEYAEQIRRSKLLGQVTADIYLSDAQLWQLYRDQHEKATIELAAIVPRTAVPDSAVPVTDEEVRRYYDEHREEFSRPATAYLSYVQILRTPDASDTAAARARAEALRREILEGAPFAEVARRESADSQSAAKGGDLGEFRRGSFDPAFEKAAWSLKIGAVSEPVLTPFGYHLIQIESRSGDRARGRHILVPIEVTGSHREALDARADSLEELAGERLDGTVLDTVARIMNLRIGQTNPVQKGTRVQIGLQVVPDAGVWAFRARPGETSRIVEVSYAYFLFRLDSLRPEGVPPLAQIRPAVELAVRNEKKREAARRLAQDVSKRLAEGSTLAQAAQALKLPHQVLGPFTRVTPPFPAPQIVGAAFGLPVGQVSDALDTPEGIYFVRVIKREPADSAQFAKAIDEFRLQQLRLARQDRVRNYLAALRDEARVTDRRDRLFTTEAQAQAAQTRQGS